MTPREVLEKLVLFCIKECGGEGDCLNCGQLPLNYEKALSDLSEIVLREQKILLGDNTSTEGMIENYARSETNKAITYIASLFRDKESGSIISLKEKE